MKIHGSENLEKMALSTAPVAKMQRSADASGIKAINDGQWWPWLRLKHGWSKG
jgi:hypothetical protein